MIYELLRPIIKFLLKQFFSAIKVRGAERAEKGPVMFVANHPNFALDALVIASVMDRQLWFLAKSTIFKGPLLSSFFRACHMVPVYRRMDSPDGTVNNDETFRVAASTLASGKAVALFPEGISMGERKLFPLRTGAARIAFQAEESAAFNLGLQIQPLGLTYTDLDKFKSAVTVTFGEPIKVSELRKAFESDAIQAVKDLTEQIEDGLRAINVEVKNAEHVDLLEKITRIYRSRDPKADDYVLMRTIAENIESQEDKLNLPSGERIVSRIDEFLDLSGAFSLDDNIPLERDYDRFFLLLTSPFLVIGLLLNYVPYRFVGFLARRVTAFHAHRASYRFGFGVLIFTAWYLVLAILILFSTQSWFVAGVAMLVVVFSSYAVNHYLGSLKLYLLSSLWPGHKKPLDILKMIRDQIISELDDYRVK